MESNVKLGFVGLLLVGAFAGVAGCASEAGDAPAPSSTPASRTTLEARVDAINYVSIASLPNARCTLRREALDSTDRGVDLFSGGDGMLHFSFKPASAGTVTELSLTCSDGAGATRAHSIELRGSADVAPLAPPSPKGRARRALSVAEAESLSPDELHAAGRPSRPDPLASPESYRRWIEYVTRPILEVSADAVTAETAQQNTVYSVSNWAGYEAVAANGPLLSVVAEWTVPTYSPGPSYGTQYDANFWIGLGDASYANGAMWQGGTDLAVTGYGVFGTVYTPNIWYELVIPGCTACPPSGCTPTSCIPQINLGGYAPPGPGEDIVAELWFARSNNPCVTGITGSDSTQYLGYLFSNQTKGYYYTGCRNVQELLTSLNRSGPSRISGGSAEWIVERALGSGGTMPLATFGSPVHMSNAQAYDVATGWQYFSARSPNWYFMVNGSDLLANAQNNSGTAVDFYFDNNL